VISRAH